MATREPKRPVVSVSGNTYPCARSEIIMDKIAPAAAARVVVNAARLAVSTPPPVIFVVEPTLKEYQLTHSTKVPNSSFTGSQA